MGNQYQAGRDIYIYPPGSSSQLKTNYEVIPKWRSPLTQARLSWIGAITGILSFFPLLGYLIPFFQFILNSVPDTTMNFLTLIAFIALIMIAIFAFRLRDLTTKQLRFPIVSGWAISGHGHRITIERIKPGKCPQCDGTMRYYYKPTDWEYVTTPNGYRKKKVTKRTPMLECCRNSDHYYPVDPTA